VGVRGVSDRRRVTLGAGAITAMALGAAAIAYGLIRVA
jgi:hypothetical protein